MAVAAPIWSDGVLVVGRVLKDGVEYDLKQIAVNQSVLGPVTYVAAVPSFRIQVVLVDLAASAGTILEWRSAATVIVSGMTVGPGAFDRNYLPGYFVQRAVGEALNARQSVGTAATIRGVLNYIEVP